MNATCREIQVLIDDLQAEKAKVAKLEGWLKYLYFREYDADKNSEISDYIKDNNI